MTEKKPIEIVTLCCGPSRKPRTGVDGNASHERVVVVYDDGSVAEIFQGPEWDEQKWEKQGGRDNTFFRFREEARNV